ncbi:uncharacterized membrane protein [Jatrophihabitans sp. GAS493]|uniref:DUF2127 domain-containing protein n=1 Tax=Jatrophihabitans sp. GAS493 TaxID=1907575 RepID=UPI000BC0D124|nr:DUF2127 domain-containing protein [Jatrophihabitans sp. GAS493]SOD73335.1 uncharacterized membrane protein [Jatrophihabitans sp. GAS493]
MDWNLRSCARHGHVTYAPTEAELRPRLHALTPIGDAWRCLRCGDYVLGDPHGDGPAQDAPVLLRGKALRSAFILRLLAIERWVRGAIILLLGIAVLRFKSTQVSVKELVDRDLASLKPFFNQINFNVADSGTIKAIQNALDAKSSTLNLVAAFLIFYGLLQIVEGTGLWMLKRWGEYFAVVATALFIPLEIYEVTERVTLLRVGALIVNIAAVAYLLYSKRLFGLRGGVKAYEADLEEVSLLEVTTSAGTTSAGGTEADQASAGR